MPIPKPRFTVFVLVRAMPAWLSLSRPAREDIATAAYAEALGQGTVTVRHFDAEAFTACCSDIVVFGTEDLVAFHCVMERLRDSALFSVPYFEVVRIIPAIEDGYRHFERMAA